MKRRIIMKTFTYTIKDELGIHARPAGMLAKTAKALDSEITIVC
jgi:phosphocarrier protein